MILLKRWTLLLIAPVLITSSSCNSDSTEASDLVGNWVSKYDFSGNARSEAVSFTVGTKSYLGLGINNENKTIRDFWEYNADANSWKKVKTFPGVARNGAIAFCVGSKGYVGTGYNGDGNKLGDFYEFTPPATTSPSDSGTWVKIGDFPGTARQDATGFALGAKGYLLGGNDGGVLKDFWEFTPGAAGSPGTWKLLVESPLAFPGFKRESAVAFVIGTKAYFGTGINNGAAMADFWEFDATTGWKEKRRIINSSDESYDDDYTSITRSNASAFTIGNIGFICTGENGAAPSDCWAYDPATDVWTKKTVFEGPARTGAVGLTVQGKGLIMTGRSGSTPYDDAWSFLPDAAQVDND